MWHFLGVALDLYIVNVFKCLYSALSGQLTIVFDSLRLQVQLSVIVI